MISVRVTGWWSRVSGMGDEIRTGTRRDEDRSGGQHGTRDETLTSSSSVRTVGTVGTVRVRTG